MPYNGSGTFAAAASSFNPAVAGTVIDQADWATMLADLTAALSAVVCKNGETTTTQRIPFAAGVGIPAGTVGSPAISFTADTDNGIYYTGANAWALSAGGVGVISVSKIDATGNIGIGQNGIPTTGYTLVVSGPVIAGQFINGSSGSASIAFWNTATSGDNVFATFSTEGTPGTLRGSIDYNRGGGAVRYNTTSSAEFKTAIVDLPAQKHDALSAVVDSVQLREFEWRENPGVKTFGVVTEELAAIYPDAVNGDGTQYDRSMFIFPLLAKCKALEDRLAALEAKV